MFLARSFSVPVEPVQKQDVVVSDRPFIPPVQQTTGVTGQKQYTNASGQMEIQKATQTVEAVSAVRATRPKFEAPGTSTEVQLTSQDVSPLAAGDRPTGPAPTSCQL